MTLRLARLKKQWRRKLKKLIAGLLFVTVLTLTLTANEPIPSNETSGNDYGIESSRTFTSDEVIRLIDSVVAETDVSIDQAYADGYKAGLLEAKPEGEFYRVQSAEVNKQLVAEQARFELPGWSIPAAFLGGFLTGFIMHERESER